MGKTSEIETHSSLCVVQIISTRMHHVHSHTSHTTRLLTRNTSLLHPHKWSFY